MNNNPMNPVIISSKGMNGVRNVKAIAMINRITPIINLLIFIKSPYLNNDFQKVEGDFAAEKAVLTEPDLTSVAKNGTPK